MLVLQITALRTLSMPPDRVFMIQTSSPYSSTSDELRLIDECLKNDCGL